MRKRSKYRPRAVLANPLGYVLESITPVAKYEQYLVDLKIKTHMAMTTLTKGLATRNDIDTLIAAVNIVEALYRLGFGKEYADVVKMEIITIKDMDKAIELVKEEFRLRKMRSIVETKK